MHKNRGKKKIIPLFFYYTNSKLNRFQERSELKAYFNS